MLAMGENYYEVVFSGRICKEPFYNLLLMASTYLKIKIAIWLLPSVHVERSSIFYI